MGARGTVWSREFRTEDVLLDSVWSREFSDGEDHKKAWSHEIGHGLSPSPGFQFHVARMEHPLPRHRFSVFQCKRKYSDLAFVGIGAESARPQDINPYSPVLPGPTNGMDAYGIEPGTNILILGPTAKPVGTYSNKEFIDAIMVRVEADLSDDDCVRLTFVIDGVRLGPKGGGCTFALPPGSCVDRTWYPLVAWQRNYNEVVTISAGVE